MLQDPGYRRVDTPVVVPVAQRDVTAPPRWRLRLRTRTTREAKRRAAFSKVGRYVFSSDFVSLVGGQHSLGPWDTEREAVAEFTRFKNLVEFGRERGPPQNAGRRESGEAARRERKAAEEREERTKKRAKLLKTLATDDGNCERQRQNVLARGELISKLDTAIRADEVHTLIRVASKIGEEPIDLTYMLVDDPVVVRPGTVAPRLGKRTARLAAGSPS